MELGEWMEWSCWSIRLWRLAAGEPAAFCCHWQCQWQVVAAASVVDELFLANVSKRCQKTPSVDVAGSTR
ncbi:hypothetical protein PF005_g20576 [Phytophthora fragariae]|uniref:Secreted protein n=1 Tax=Phytophthora fragariae TaxID=53985 RepID=A0A6A3XMU1_9STRA|nr:hypothetical protein PF009_g21672 [Phytophthora fragariae]KAE9113975.1 hypothetical protein PF006_g19620 [Phytophthora fragariae]KAE9187130.1 hypothetical protein PF005_g20576 [Phytophthora fragariae]KAE9198702.1 hypothetical protein PF004_g19473 [Phytophthora fragariae]KAE9200325.1 hypothetical protein PF002_g21868 [Phytophthora fragariae]